MEGDEREIIGEERRRDREKGKEEQQIRRKKMTKEKIEKMK